MNLQENASREAVEEQLSEIFGRPEFQEGGALEDGFADAFQGVGQSLGSAGTMMVRLLPLLLILGLIYFTIRAARAHKRTVGFAEVEGRSSVKERVSEILARARKARTEGDRRQSLRLYCFALVAGLGVSGDVSYRPAWTNRELLRRGQPKAEAKRLLEELITDLEGKEYGRDEVTDRDLDHLEDLCASHLGQVLAGRGV